MKARGCRFRQNFPESSRLCRGFLVPLVARRSGAAGHGSIGLEYTLTNISHSHLAADPPTIVCSVGFGMLLTERFLVPSWAPEGKVLWRGISWRQSRSSAASDVYKRQATRELDASTAAVHEL